MASKTIEFPSTSGLTLTVELFPFGSDTIANTGGDSATEATNRDGIYHATIAEAISGWHTVHVKLGSTVVYLGYVYLLDVSATYRVLDVPIQVDALGQVSTDEPGDGDVSVDHDYGGTDALRVLDTSSNPVDNAKIEAFLATDTGHDDVLARAFTGTDGRWIAPMMLDADDYELVVSKAGAMQEKVVELTVS